jgi:hypothetical protein
VSAWEAVKIREVYTYGVEFLFGVGLKSSTNLFLGYTFLKSESEKLGNYISKYAMNHPSTRSLWGSAFLFPGEFTRI